MMARSPEHTLLRVHRSNTDCVFRLLVRLRPDDPRKGISFTEFYDYLPSAGDSGREYAYTVAAGYPDLARLVEFLEGRFDPAAEPGADLEARLIGCLAAAVERGDLGDNRALRANRDRVQDWLTEAGIEAHQDHWVWFNSD